MKYLKYLLLIVGTATSITMTKLQAETHGTCRVIGIIGTDMVVELNRHVIIAEINVGTIGTSGTDQYYMGDVDVSLFNNNLTAATYFCYITSEEADSDNNFRLLFDTDTSEYIRLIVTTDTSTGGVLLSQPANVLDGSILRTYVAGTDPIIEDEVLRITVYATDNAGNLMASGVYEAYLHFGWVVSS